MDYFALLDQPRLPWLDADALKAAFLARAAPAHPDRVHEAAAAEKLAANQTYTDLNAAYQCLREPKERLAHLLELETGHPPDARQSNTAGVNNLFFALAPVLQEVDKFFKEKARAASPLAQAQRYAAGLEWSDKLMEFQRQINWRRQNLEAELEKMNAAWTSAPPLERAAQLYGEFSFLKRWSEQIQERLSRLAAD